MLATYTGVLVGNTAIPIWDAMRRRLPLQFAATSASALASLLELVGSPRRSYSIVAKTAELATGEAIERAAVAAGVGRPLREGRSGRMWRGAKWIGVASLAATLLGRPQLAGALGTGASVLVRFAVIEAGKASAADPRATFEPQRRGRQEIDDHGGMLGVCLAKYIHTAPARCSRCAHAVVWHGFWMS